MFHVCISRKYGKKTPKSTSRLRKIDATRNYFLEEIKRN